MASKLDPKLVRARIGTAITFAVSIFVIGLFHGNQAIDMISGALGIGSLFAGIGFEIYETHQRRDRIEEAFLAEQQKHDQTLHHVTAEFSVALKASEERLAALMERYCPLINDPWIDRLLERPGSSAMHKVWRSFLIEHAARHLDGSRRIFLSEETDGRIRIDIMGRAIYNATRYAFGYTRATKEHYEEFWGDRSQNGSLFFRADRGVTEVAPFEPQKGLCGH